ncbi:MAG: hypothetical protein H6Q67_1035 [Firmicutes bacterium]|nr:hypothetical protein [Bacillota bacterium]
MFTINQESIDKDELSEIKKNVDKKDLLSLVDLLAEKNNNIRYQVLRQLQEHSKCSNGVYQFWDIFKNKLKSENSYQRSIGLMLIADNTKWDDENKINKTIDDYLEILYDEKPITVRQCIQALHKIIPYKKHLHFKIADKLMEINILNLKVTMQKLILFDILQVLVAIKKQQTTDEIDSYIVQALNGEILDRKTKKQIESTL